MVGALFGYQNAVDTAALSAGSEPPNMRSVNLADPILMNKWRALASSSDFVADFSAETRIDFLALFGATLGPSDSIRHRLYDASNVLIFDQTVAAGVVSGYGAHFYGLSAPVTAAHWRCDITATSRTALGYFDVGRAWAGPAFVPSIGVSLGWSNGWMDDADQGRAKYSGITFVGAGARRRAVEFTLDYMDDIDKASAEDMALACGVRNQVVFVPFTEGDVAREAILGKFVNPDLIAQPADTVPPTYSQKFRIEQDC